MMQIDFLYITGFLAFFHISGPVEERFMISEAQKYCSRDSLTQYHMFYMHYGKKNMFVGDYKE